MVLVFAWCAFFQFVSATITVDPPQLHNTLSIPVARLGSPSLGLTGEGGVICFQGHLQNCSALLKDPRQGDIDLPHSPQSVDVG